MLKHHKIIETLKKTLLIQHPNFHGRTGTSGPGETPLSIIVSGSGCSLEATQGMSELGV